MWRVKKLFATPPFTPTTQDVQIALPGLKHQRQSKFSTAWLTPEGEAIQASLHPACTWPFI